MRRVLVWPALLGGLLLAMALSATLGAVRIESSDWFAPSASGSAQVLWNLRMPRVALAAVVGAALGLAGAMTQGLFRNPLADPGLLGVSSGATCAVALMLTVFASWKLALPPEWRLWLLPAAAFVGAVAVCLALDRLARWLTPGSVAGLLLTGLALNAVTMAVVGLCSFLATDDQLRNLSFWTLGSLAGAGWPLVIVVAIGVAGAAWRMRRLAHPLNALALGEAAAAQVGIAVARLRSELVVLVALLSALAVAWCGFIGFIGLMAPHLVRGVARHDQRRLLPLAMGAGALLLVLADTVARTIAVPAELPVGIFTSLIGGPGFLFMLRATVRSQGGHA